jgi:hypothetical protein
VVSSTPRPQFTPGKDPVLILQEAGRAPGLVWTGGKFRLQRVSIPDRSAGSSVAIPTELPVPHFCLKVKVIVKVKFTLEQATKAQSGSRVIAELFL